MFCQNNFELKDFFTCCFFRDDDVAAYVQELINQVPNMDIQPVVFVGRDTRLAEI